MFVYKGLNRKNIIPTMLDICSTSAIIVIHHHNCSDLIRRKRNEVRRLTVHLEAKNSVLEEQITDLKAKVDDLDEQIAVLEQRKRP
jgi:cell division protein FtsB